MARNREALNRILRRGEDAGLLVCTAALMLVEVGYVAWLERLPALPSPAHPAGFIDLPPWYERPRVEVTLLLTVLAGRQAPRSEPKCEVPHFGNWADRTHQGWAESG